MARAPGFANLSDEERSAIVDFSLLWSLFEARILDNAGSAAAICGKIEDWHGAGSLHAPAFDPELTYFRQRYFANGEPTSQFYGLNLRKPDRAPLVRSVLDGSNADPCDCVAATFIVVLRYRNNLFHGMKWHYLLAGQLENFTAANSAIMKALDQHGQLHG